MANKSNLRRTIIVIILYVAVLPLIIASGLLAAAYIQQATEFEILSDKARLQAQQAMFVQLHGIEQSISVAAESTELSNFINAPSKLRGFSENLFIGKLIAVQASLPEIVNWIVLDKNNKVIFSLNDLFKNEIHTSEGFGLIKGGSIISYKRLINFDDQDLYGKTASFRGSIIGFVDKSLFLKSLPSILDIFSLPKVPTVETIIIKTNTINSNSSRSFIIIVCFIAILIFSIFLGLRHFNKNIILPILALVADVTAKALPLRIYKPQHTVEGIDEFSLLRNTLDNYTDAIERAHNQIIIAEKNQAIMAVAKQVAHDIRSPLTALDVVMRTELGMSEEKRILARSAITRIKDIANDLLEKNRAPQAQFQGQASSQTQPQGQQQGLYENQQDQSANQQTANGAFAGGATQATGAGANDTQTHRAAVNVSQGPSATLLVSMLESLLSEKRLQYRPRLGVEIDYQADVSAYGLFTNVDPIEFKRLISNLINNAVEALPQNKGKVTLSLASKENKIQIAITDNGKGIPAHILPTLGKSGVSYSKEGTDSGTGLGLFHAKKTIELFGGELKIESIEGKGTTIRIILPLAKSPDWFVEKLKIKSNSQIFIVDDDSSIHQIWQGRLESLQFKKYNIEILNFSNPIDLENWVKSHPIKSDSIFLVDYEFLGHTQNGLDIINTLSLANQSILITSRYEEPQILQRAQNMNVNLIPKGIAGLVPIEILDNETDSRNQTQPNVSANHKADAVLIDDDALMHATWKSAAKNSGKNLKTFFTADEFLNEYQNFTNKVPIYIDVSLAGGARGDELARKIYDMGFSNIYLSTGYEKSEFSELTFLKGVIGKTPPW
jgi:signal transduction histidine kinase